MGAGHGSEHRESLAAWHASIPPHSLGPKKVTYNSSLCSVNCDSAGLEAEKEQEYGYSQVVPVSPPARDQTCSVHSSNAAFLGKHFESYSR